MEYNKSSNQSRSKCITESTHISPSLHFTGGRCLLLLLSLVAAPVAGRSWPAGAAGPRAQQGGCSSPALPEGAAGRTEAAGAVGWEELGAVGRSSSKADRAGRALQRGERRRQRGAEGPRPWPAGRGRSGGSEVRGGRWVWLRGEATSSERRVLRRAEPEAGACGFALRTCGGGAAQRTGKGKLRWRPGLGC